MTKTVTAKEMALALYDGIHEAKKAMNRKLKPAELDAIKYDNETVTLWLTTGQRFTISVKDESKTVEENIQGKISAMPDAIKEAARRK